MGNKHRWYDVIVAWANGEKIQVRATNPAYTNNTFEDFTSTSSPDFNFFSSPGFDNENTLWRIKPKTKLKRYRMALITICKPQKEIIVVDVTDSSIDDPAEYNVVGFIRWVGDVVEVEIEV